MLLPPDVAGFITWFAAFQQKIGALVGVVMHTDVARAHSEVGGPSDAEWSQWLDASAHPQLTGLRSALAQSVAVLNKEQPLRALAEELASAVAALPEQASLYEPSGEDDPERRVSVEVPLRRWFEIQFTSEALPAFPELERALSRALEEASRRIAEVERVLDYYTLAAQRNAAAFEAVYAEEFARTGLGRVQTLIDDLHRRRKGMAQRALAAFVDRTASALEDASAPFRAHQPGELLRRLDEYERLRAKGPAKQRLLPRAVRKGQRLYRRALPISRKVSSELRALFTEQEPDARGSQFRALVATDADELGGDLPLSYRRLYSVAPIETSDLYVPRTEVEEACWRAIEAWISGVPQALLVHGDRGAGKRTLVNHVLARVRSQALLDVRWVRLDVELRDEASVASTLAKALGFPFEARAFADLTVVPAERTRRRVIVLENAERLLPPSPEGVRRMIDFLGMVGETATTTLWVLLMSTSAAALALDRLGLANRVTTIVQVEPMDAATLRRMIMARHRLSGFELEFRAPGMNLLDFVTHPVASFRQRAPSETFFARLGRLSGGNPRQAMYYWLSRASRHAQQEGRVVLEPLPPASAALLPRLTLSQRLILSILAQHETLSSSELVLALSLPPESVEGDLKVLWAYGYVRPSRKLPRHFTLGTTIAHPLLMELRSMNML